MTDAAQNLAPAGELETTDLQISCENGHRWLEKWPLPMTMQAFAKRMKATSECPTCSAPTFLGWQKEMP